MPANSCTSASAFDRRPATSGVAVDADVDVAAERRLPAFEWRRLCRWGPSLRERGGTDRCPACHNLRRCIAGRLVVQAAGPPLSSRPDSRKQMEIPMAKPVPGTSLVDPGRRPLDVKRDEGRRRLC